MNCIIMKGVRIGKNSVIGADSVVVKDCEPNSVYAKILQKKLKKLKYDFSSIELNNLIGWTSLNSFPPNNWEITRPNKFYAYLVY